MSLKLNQTYQNSAESSQDRATQWVRAAAVSAGAVVSSAMLLGAVKPGQYYLWGPPAVAAVGVFAAARGLGRRLAADPATEVFEVTRVDLNTLVSDERGSIEGRRYHPEIEAAHQVLSKGDTQARRGAESAKMSRNAAAAAVLICGLVAAAGPREPRRYPVFVDSARLPAPLRLLIHQVGFTKQAPPPLVRETVSTKLGETIVQDAIEALRPLAKPPLFAGAKDPALLSEYSGAEVHRVDAGLTAIDTLNQFGLGNSTPELGLAETLLQDYRGELQNAKNGQPDPSALENAAKTAAQAVSKLVNSLLELYKELFAFLKGVFEGLGGAAQDALSKLGGGKSSGGSGSRLPSQADVDAAYDALTKDLHGREIVALPAPNPPKANPNGPAGVAGAPKIPTRRAPGPAAPRGAGEVGNGSTTETHGGSSGNKPLIRTTPL